VKYDREEQSILDAYEKGDIHARPPSRTEINEVKNAAKNTFRKDQRITIRLYDHDLKGIKKKAMEKGLPYQTLVSGVIHQYVEGELAEKK